MEYLQTVSIFYNSKIFLHYAVATREKTKSVSLRQICDYMSHVVGMYKFNHDFYQCYTKARENPKIGYLWYCFGEFGCLCCCGMKVSKPAIESYKAQAFIENTAVHGRQCYLWYSQEPTFWKLWIHKDI